MAQSFITTRRSRGSYDTCGFTVEDKLMQKTRYLDKLIDELAKGKTMEKILKGLKEANNDILCVLCVSAVNLKNFEPQRRKGRREIRGV